MVQMTLTVSLNINNHMRAYQFLIEYDRSREQQRVEALPAYQQRIKQDPKFSLEKLESGDPTPQKIYVPRLVQWWLAGKPTEDLISTTADALAKYHQLKNKKLIKPEHADIGRFKTADQFTDAVDQYQLPTDEPKQDRGKYKEIFRDADLLVVQLLDETAAKFWGQNTKWCTASDRNNQFDRYFELGPLFVIIPRKDPSDKYQYWFESENPYELQFMNARNKEVNPSDLPFFEKLQPIMKKVSPHFMWETDPKIQLDVVSRHANYIKWIKNPSEELQMAAISNGSGNILWIKNPAESVKMAAVKQTGLAIKYIKNPNEAIQLAAVKRDGTGTALEYIENPTEQVQLFAVRQKPAAIQYIKNPSEAVQMAAVQKNGRVIWFIDNPSEDVKTAAVNESPWAIDYIKNPSEKLQMLALTKDHQVFTKIKNPTPAVRELAEKLYRSK